VVLALRWVDDALAAYEEFIGLYEVDSIKSITLSTILKDYLLQFNLPLSKVHGQCFDRASNKSGVR